ncbi:MAG: hypothetical protein L7F77_04590 [Candidatus Magnetominusculus sp. LBB02]|nr:hypothetical protein [Candidatus Magnetominusculus sp. LBB02]
MRNLGCKKVAACLIVLAITMCLALPVFAKDSGNIEDTPKFTNIYEGLPDKYRDMYEKHTGLSVGAGPWGTYFPVPKLHMYWSPEKHYEPSNKIDHTIFIEKNRTELCVKCHEGINVGTVRDWQNSAHFNPNKTQFTAMRTKQIEADLGRKIEQVTCFDCHVNAEKKIIRMPSANVCGQCHGQQVQELMQERDHGRPNHIQGWESNVVPPWYGEAGRRGQIIGMVGCDMCHAATEKCDGCHTRHTFSATEARKPEACMSCHMGPDHPDAETYRESKHGMIYEMEKEHFDFTKPLSQVQIGKDYRTPTCQLCHMYQGSGRFSHNFVAKGIWRMGTVPPKQIDFQSSLKDYPYGIKIIPPKIDLKSPDNIEKRAKWIELCSKCHGPRFAEIYLETLDDYMIQAFKMTDEAQLIIDNLFRDNMIYPSVPDRDIYPMGDHAADVFGKELLGEGVYNAFKLTGGKIPVVGPILGVYGLFYQGINNPSEIENTYAKMWFFYKNQGYKGTAHAQQDYSWWWGQAPMLHSLGSIRSEDQRLRRIAADEAKYKLRSVIVLSTLAILIIAVVILWIRRRKD